MLRRCTNQPRRFASLILGVGFSWICWISGCLSAEDHVFFDDQGDAATAPPDGSASNADASSSADGATTGDGSAPGDGAVAGSFTVGGTVIGLSGTGLVLKNSGGDDIIVNASGNFTFATPVKSGSAFTVTIGTQPSSPSQTCNVTNGAGVVGSANVTNVVVNCATGTFLIGGTVNGLLGSGLQLTLTGGTPSPADMAVAGGATSFAFTAPVTGGGAYNVAVTAQPTGPSQTCTVSSGIGTVTSANVTSVVVTCTTTAFTVGGSVTGLVGAGLILQNNGTNNEPVTGNGTRPFTFSTPVPSGQPYAVTVQSQPNGQFCFPMTASGSVGGANVTTVVVRCHYLENFDLGPGALPIGWSTTSSATAGAAPPVWAKVAHSASSPSESLVQHVFAPNAATNAGTESTLTSRQFSIVSTNAVLRFWHWYNTEIVFDGGVLEMQINAGAWQDVVTAGGVFAGGGYNATLSTVGTNPFKGRAAWNGNSAAYVQTTVNLPASAAGQTATFRWRMGNDNTFVSSDPIPSPGWHVDSIDLEP